MSFFDGSNVQIVFALQETQTVAEKSKKRRKINGDDVLTLTLKVNKQQRTPFGSLSHDEIIGSPIGSRHITDQGVVFYALTPTIADATLAFPRGAAIIYPKDAAFITTFGDIAPGMRVLECGLGSGALTCSLLRATATAPTNATNHAANASTDKEKSNIRVTSIEKREDFYNTGVKNVLNFFGADSPSEIGWEAINTSLEEYLGVHDGVTKVPANSYSRIILDLLNPWDYIESITQVLEVGGILIIYITTVPQMTELSQAFSRLSVDGRHFINIECVENIRRPWKMEDLSIRPEHQGILHSGFIVTARLV